MTAPQTHGPTGPQQNGPPGHKTAPDPEAVERAVYAAVSAATLPIVQRLDAVLAEDTAPSLSAAPGPAEAPRRAQETPRPTRAILEDRYDGLLMNLSPRKGMVGDYNGLQERFDAILRDLMDGTLRFRHTDADDALVGELQAHVREWVITWAAGHPEERTVAA